MNNMMALVAFWENQHRIQRNRGMMNPPVANNPSEAQLYCLLHRANLLSYFDMFISQGGDDVKQLCEAGEEEFMEIMNLVGMDTKPLHIRRLQKALQEWITNPSVFTQPDAAVTASGPPARGSALSRVVPPGQPPLGPSAPVPGPSNSPGAAASQLHQMAVATAAAAGEWSPHMPGGRGASPGMPTTLPTAVGTIWGGSQGDRESPTDYEGGMANHNEMMEPMAYVQTTLTEDQLVTLETAAKSLCDTLPHYEPKPINTKKPVNRELEATMKMDENDPERITKLRKFGAIYGRFDSKRKSVGKPMSMHEVSVNEAAAQICRHRPELLTRRDELFPLARQLVKECGFNKRSADTSAGPSMAKRSKLEIDFSQRSERRQQEINDRLKAIATRQMDVQAKLQEVATDEQTSLQLEEELNLLNDEQASLMAEQADLSKYNDRSGAYKSDEERGSPSSEEFGTTGPAVADEQGQQATETEQEASLRDVGLRFGMTYGLSDFVNFVRGSAKDKEEGGEEGAGGDNLNNNHQEPAENGAEEPNPEELALPEGTVFVKPEMVEDERKTDSVQ